MVGIQPWHLYNWGKIEEWLNDLSRVLSGLQAHTNKSEDDSSPKEVYTAGQHVNTASSKVNTGRFKLNTVDPSVNIASLSDPDALKIMFIIELVIPLKATHSSVQTRRMTKPTSEQGFLSAVYKEKTHDTLNTCLYACFLSQIEPTSIAKALSDSSWVEAMQEELFQFKLQQVWKLCGFALIVKRAIGTNGHRQEEDIDYEEVFALVARIEAIRLNSTTLMKSASTLVDLEKPLVKDEDADDVDCKKQTVVATSTTEAEYVAAASCCRQVLWIQNQLLDYGYNFMNTVINIDNNNLLTKGFDAGRHVKRGRDTKIPQSSGPPVKVGDEAVHKELGDRMERAATTASSLEAEQDSGNINRTQSMATLNEPNP
ncbi:hypothetical protein Tco_1554021 [Tanacetum coccineum]